MRRAHLPDIWEQLQSLKFRAQYAYDRLWQLLGADDDRCPALIVYWNVFALAARVPGDHLLNLAQKEQQCSGVDLVLAGFEWNIRGSQSGANCDSHWDHVQ